MKDFGYMVDVEHGYGYKTRYGHLSSLAVRLVMRSVIINWLDVSVLQAAPQALICIMKSIAMVSLLIHPISFLAVNFHISF